MISLGINALFNASGGSLTNLRLLLGEWSNMDLQRKYEIFIFCTEENQKKIQDINLNGFKVVTIKSGFNNFIARMLNEQFKLPILLRKHKISVLFSLANTTPYLSKIPTVVNFQNMAPFCEDVTWSKMGFGAVLNLKILGLMIRFSALRADCIIVNSNYFSKFLSEYKNVPISKLTVIYRTFETKTSRQDQNLLIADSFFRDQPFLLTVSHLYPFRRIIEIIEGFAESKHRESCRLLIVGGFHVPRYTEKINLKIKHLNLKERVILLGALPHQDVIELIKDCFGFVFASTCENCPTSLLEALYLEKPIACSDVGVMPEIAGRAAIYFNPNDTKEITKSIDMIFEENIREKIIKEARERVVSLPSSNEVAKQTLNVIEETLQKKLCDS